MMNESDEGRHIRRAAVAGWGAALIGSLSVTKPCLLPGPWR